MLKILAVGTGGFLGAIARWTLSNWVQSHTGWSFPYGTLAVNVLGCVAIGAVSAWIEATAAWTPEVRLLVTVGILGSFTTFSTLGFEAFEFLRVGSHRAAVAVVVSNVILGLLGVWLGRASVRAGATWLAGSA